jgi:hypothetical protein
MEADADSKQQKTADSRQQWSKAVCSGQSIRCYMIQNRALGYNISDHSIAFLRLGE